MKDLRNMSADYKRIAGWLYDGRFELAKKMINMTKEKYKDIPKSLGGYENVWSEVDNILKISDKNKSAEKSLTLSMILMNKSL